MARGKRKAEDSESEAEEDTGRLESQEMFSTVLRAFKVKDDGWSKSMTTQIEEDGKALNKLLNDKERELADIDSRLHEEVRSLLTHVLSPPVSGSKKRRGEAFDLRPGHDHAQLLFTQSDQIINFFNMASKAIEDSDLASDQTQRFDTDKKSVSELLHAGQEVSRRRIKNIIKQPEETVSRKKSRNIFSDQKLDEAAAIFEALRRKDDGDDDDEQSEVEKAVDIERPGIYPLIHDGKKGVKKLAGKLIYEDE